MNKKAGLYIIASILISFFLASLASAAYKVKVNLSTLGGGTGKVTFSATSSHDFEFFGWSGESCIGNRFCILMGLVPNSSKVVTASFNAPVCVEFTYSEFGACQLSGFSYRTVVAAGPPRCVGGNPAISKGCFYDPCSELQNVDLRDDLQYRTTPEPTNNDDLQYHTDSESTAESDSEPITFITDRPSPSPSPIDIPAYDTGGDSSPTRPSDKFIHTGIDDKYEYTSEGVWEKTSVEENTVGSGNGEVVQRIAKFEYTPYDPSREGSISGPEGEEVITVGAAKSKEVVISELVATIRPEPKPEPGPVLDPNVGRDPGQYCRK